jgi:glycosyltransferase involved in cell wall biosynthesis
MRCCCVIPVFNHAATAPAVIERTRAVMRDVLVIDDGSEDIDLKEHYAGTGVEVIRHPRNMGKGAAILTAIRTLAPRGYDCMITLDADAQHDPEDIPRFLAVLEKNDWTLVVGVRDFSVPNVPGRSKFGRAFSNFWFLVETGKKISDSQSGFRAYPLQYVSRIKCSSLHYTFETELLTRCMWAGLDLAEVPIFTHYDPPGERVSHFHPFRDNLRMTWLHTRLVLRRLVPFGVKKLRETPREFPRLWKPKELWAWLVKENTSSLGLAFSAFVGALLAVYPLYGVCTITILYVASRLHLNKAMAVMAQHPFQPPVCPVVCIELGYFLRHGKFLLPEDLNFHSTVREIHLRWFEWLLGSIILAPIFAAIFAVAVYFSAELCRAVIRRRSARS